jgi:uncharacterized protein
MVLRLDRDTARRVAVSAQLLTAERPADIVEAVDGLTIVNVEPTAAIAPSADLILWSRLGWPYQPADLARVEQVDRAVFEWRGFYRAMTDLPLLGPQMRQAPAWANMREWFETNDRFRRDVLERLRTDGPLHAAEVPDTADVSWRSSGWTDNRNAQQMMEILVARGEAAVWGRDAKGRLFDLAERVYPADMPELTDEEAMRERAERRLGSLGIAREKSVAQPGEPIDVGDVGERATVDEAPGEWRVDAAALAAAESFAPRTALLSPFDRMVFDRGRLTDLFGYEYILEMYKPAPKRRWGYFALPILHGDRFVGKLDAKADRKAGVLRIHAVHEDVPFKRAVAEAVDAEIAALAAWLGLDLAYT